MAKVTIKLVNGNEMVINEDLSITQITEMLTATGAVAPGAVAIDRSTSAGRRVEYAQPTGTTKGI